MPELSSAMPLDEKALAAARLLPIGSERHEVIRAYLSSLTPSPVGEPHPVSMSMFATKDDMLRHLLAERKQTASELEALRKRVAELERAGAFMATILYNCASHATLPYGTRNIMHEAREAWDDTVARRVREGGKADG